MTAPTKLPLVLDVSGARVKPVDAAAMVAMSADDGSPRTPER